LETSDLTLLNPFGLLPIHCCLLFSEEEEEEEEAARV
jgi:hypothetical protein